MSATQPAWRQIQNKPLKAQITAVFNAASNVITDQDVLTLTVPAGRVVVGDTFEAEMIGATGNGITASNFTPYVKIGSTKLALPAQGMGTTAQSNIFFHVRILITVRSTGVSATIVGNGIWFWKTNIMGTGSASSATQDTTASFNIVLGFAFSVANASNTCAVQIATISQQAG